MKKYLFVAKMRIQNMMAYRFNICLTTVMDCLIMVAIGFFWRAVYGDTGTSHGVTADTITQAMEQVAGAGAYVKLTDSTVVGGENESFDGEYAVAVLYCKHEKKKVVYQFSIDPSYQLIGFSAQIR